MRKYASNTTVSPDRSRAEIERCLERFGASSFGYWRNDQVAVINFQYRGAQVRIAMPLLAEDDKQFTHSDRGRKRSTSVATVAWRKETRRRWRSLTLSIKAKLVAIADGVATFEQEFLPYLVWGDGRTIGEHLLPTIEDILDGDAKMPRLPVLKQLTNSQQENAT